MNDISPFRSLEPNELDSTVTALGNIWKQAFKQLRDPDATTDDIEAMSIASTELLRQVLRLSREGSTSVISREQLRHINLEDTYNQQVLATQGLVRELHSMVKDGFDHIDMVIKPIIDRLDSHENRIKALEDGLVTLKERVA